MNALLDTNVLLEWVLRRSQNFKSACRIIIACIDKGVQGFVTSHSLTDFFYITRKNFSIEQRKKLMLFIVSNFTVLIEDNNIFFHALFGRDFFDLEDALQIACAEHAQLDYIVTENMRDFKHSKIPAVSIGDFVHKIMQ